MQKRILGRTGLEVPPLCIGMWQLAGPVFFDGKPDGHPDPGRENVLRLIAELFERGINFLDAAEQYGDGESERRAGVAMRGRRDRWVLSTKFGYRVGPGGTRVDDSSPPTILPSLEGSLKRLGTDYIDIYLYHCAPKVDDLDAAREILETARRQGKIRHYGISTNDFGLIRELARRDMLDVLQYAASLLQPSHDIREFVAARNIGVQVRGVMAQGRLSGKYFAGAPQWDPADNRSERMRAEHFERYAALQRCVPAGRTMGQVAIRWALDQPGHHTICMGAKNLADYESAIEAVNMPPLDAETLRCLDGAVRELGAS